MFDRWSSFIRRAAAMALVLVACCAAGCEKAPPPPTDPAQAPWLLDPKLQIEHLKSDDFRLRGIAAFNLGNMGAKASDGLPELERLAKDDPEAKVRKLASEAAAKIRAASK